MSMHLVHMYGADAAGRTGSITVTKDRKHTCPGELSLIRLKIIRPLEQSVSARIDVFEFCRIRKSFYKTKKTEARDGEGSPSKANNSSPEPRGAKEPSVLGRER